MSFVNTTADACRRFRTRLHRVVSDARRSCQAGIVNRETTALRIVTQFTKSNITRPIF
jgi:hypothetical protein